MAEDNKVTVTANYSSPTNEPFAFNHTLNAPPSESVPDKTQYLSSLRETIAAAQDKINKELTARMEEDKARSADSKPAAAKAVDEDKEEENYGEEVQEEED